MLHANEAWRQLTGAELQRGVSTGLWESFEFLAVQPQASPISSAWPDMDITPAGRLSHPSAFRRGSGIIVTAPLRSRWESSTCQGSSAV